jgi:hypothetical protein
MHCLGQQLHCCCHSLLHFSVPAYHDAVIKMGNLTFGECQCILRVARMLGSLVTELSCACKWPCHVEFTHQPQSQQVL